MADELTYVANGPVDNSELNALFADAWLEHEERDFSRVLSRSLGYVCARDGADLVGFVNVAWDGGVHAFLLDTTVRSDMQRRGIGSRLVSEAETLAREAGAGWLHVDYEPRLGEFYTGCGFRKCEAGLIKLS